MKQAALRHVLLPRSARPKRFAGRRPQRGGAGHVREDEFRILQQIPFRGIHTSPKAGSTLFYGPQRRLDPSWGLSRVRFEQGRVVGFHPEVRHFLARVLEPGLPLDTIQDLLLHRLNG